MSNFSFSHSVFKRLVSQGRQKVSSCGNGLNEGDAKFKFRKVDYSKTKVTLKLDFCSGMEL